MSIEISDVRKRFGDFTALDGIDLAVPDGELVALLGPSGCGKTTLLRVIAGLETPDTGAIRFHGEDTTDTHVRERKVGFVFQHYALFQHMSVFENVAFGLRVRPRATRPSNTQIRDSVMSLLKLVQLDWLADRYPNQLSGGQRQRIALARALAVEPRVLLLDEPFGALDAKVRKELRRWLRRLHDDLHITSVFVTHDQEEALEVADRVVVMNKGRVEQIGTPDEIYQHPQTPFVYHFLGDVNRFSAQLDHGEVLIGSVRQPAPEYRDAIEMPACAFARPHDIDLLPEAVSGQTLAADVDQVHTLGPIVRVELFRRGQPDPVEVILTRERFEASPVRRGDTVHLSLRKLRVFPEQVAKASRT